jgi:hypothetical protein
LTATDRTLIDLTPNSSSGSYAGGVLGRLSAAGLVSALAVAAMSVGALAETSTSDRIPGPPAGSWQVYADDTRAMTAGDLYGAQASAVKGFVDAYQKTWATPEQGLTDLLEHFSSVFWAAFDLAESEAAAKKDKGHSSYAAVAGLGSGAYEVTDPADAQGFRYDTLVFTWGDYVAVIALAAQNATPDHSVLMDQANRQLSLMPVPIGEYESIGSAAITTVALIGGVIVAIAFVAGAIVLIVLVRRRRPRAAPILVGPGGLNLSPDRRHWWDGHYWIDASFQSPPSAQRSADGAYWWDGETWRPVPQTIQPPSSGR